MPKRRGVEDVDGVAGADDFNVVAGVNDVGRVLGGGRGALRRWRPWSKIAFLVEFWQGWTCDEVSPRRSGRYTRMTATKGAERYLCRKLVESNGVYRMGRRCTMVGNFDGEATEFNFLP